MSQLKYMLMYSELGLQYLVCQLPKFNPTSRNHNYSEDPAFPSFCQVHVLYRRQYIQAANEGMQSSDPRVSRLQFDTRFGFPK